MVKRLALKDLQSYQVSVKRCGKYITTKEYSSVMYRGGVSSSSRGYAKREDGDKLERSIQRTRITLLDLINCNLTTYTKFITFTFKETMLLRSIALMEFDKFRKRFEYHFGYKLKYVMVSERQKERGLKENNSGSWHFHMVAFINEKIDFKLLKKCWNLGSVDIKKIDNVDNVGRYIAKYITKDMLDCNLNKKLIYTSQGLNRPKVSYLMNYKNDLLNDNNKKYECCYGLKNNQTEEPVICKLTEYKL